MGPPTPPQKANPNNNKILRPVRFKPRPHPFSIQPSRLRPSRSRPKPSFPFHPHCPFRHQAQNLALPLFIPQLRSPQSQRSPSHGPPLFRKSKFFSAPLFFFFFLSLSRSSPTHLSAIEAPLAEASSLAQNRSVRWLENRFLARPLPWARHSCRFPTLPQNQSGLVVVFSPFSASLPSSTFPYRRELAAVIPPFLSSATVSGLRQPAVLRKPGRTPLAVSLARAQTWSCGDAAPPPPPTPPTPPQDCLVSSVQISGKDPPPPPPPPPHGSPFSFVPRP